MKQPHRFLFLMDPARTLNLATETSLLFMEDLIARGHEVLWAEVDGLILRQDRLFARARPIVSTAPLDPGTYAEIPVDDMSALLVRPDPPFDANYLHLTYLLDFVSPDVLQLNRGAALRDFNEKLSTLHFADTCPQTLTTMNQDALLAFLKEHGDIVVKPLDECSGRGIERISDEAEDVEKHIEAVLKSADGQARFVTAQRFLSDVARGDKRVFIAFGEPVGIVNRIPRPGGWLGNIHQGAQCVASELSEAEMKIIERLRPFLETNGIHLAGLDFIGERLTEVNITSPSALRQINEVTRSAVHTRVIDLILEHLEP